MSDIVSPATTEVVSYHQATELVDCLVAAGMDTPQMKRILGSENNARAKRMIAHDRVGHESPDERLFRRIMGNSYFGREEWGDIYGVSLTAQQSRKIAKLSWSEELLDSECLAAPGKSVAEACFAFLGMDKLCGQPLTIMQWQQIHPEGGQPRFYNYGSDCWYPNEQFVAIPLELKWYLALKEIVQGSANTSWNDMQPMVYDGYRMPSPIEETTKDFLYYQKFEVYPNINQIGRAHV